jgi:hypothetical protein
MSALIPALTHVGRLALQEAKAGGPAVILSQVSFGSAPRLPTQEETELVAPFISGPISSHTINPQTGQLDVGVQIDGAVEGLTQDYPVHEAGLFDQLGRLIFYFASPDTLASITPRTAYALTIGVVLAQADAETIQITDQGPPWEVLVDLKIAALEARTRRASFRNLFLAQA